MRDVQGEADTREIPIDQVGVTDLHYPIVVLDKEHERQQTTARVTMSVDLPKEFKGTHMSRFIEVLNDHRGEVTMRTMPKIVADLKERLSAGRSRVEVQFRYFVERKAPVSESTALMDYECTFIAESNGNSDDFVLGVQVPVTSVCPCSKAISERGAHNQRGQVFIDVRTNRGDDGLPELVWIEELIEIAESSASAPVRPLLKREDEKYVTEQAYDNPVFVEDIVRNVVMRLKQDPRIDWYRVKAVNHESIHNHGAFAIIEHPRS